MSSHVSTDRHRELEELAMDFVAFCFFAKENPAKCRNGTMRNFFEERFRGDDVEEDIVDGCLTVRDALTSSQSHK